MRRRLVALALVVLACALPVSAVQALQGPPIRSFGELIDAITTRGTRPPPSSVSSPVMLSPHRP